MTDLSPFQTLPIHIAEAIARYCIGLQRHRRSDIYKEMNKAKHVWIVLHDVSRFWMQLARRNLNKRVTLRLSNNSDGCGFTTKLDSRRVLEQSTAIISYVKEVDIYFDDIVEEPNEEDLEKLGQDWPEDFVFSEARSLTCYLKPKHTSTSDDARNDKYFKWFIERVRSSFPNLQKTTIEFGESGMISVSPGVLFSKEWNAGLYLSALVRAARWGMDEGLNPANMDNVNILIKNAPELTGFRYFGQVNDKVASWAIKKSAVTLENLHYGGTDGGVLKEFMFDDDGQVIVYPRLRDLQVYDSSNAKGERTTHESIVPFPVLQRLMVHSSCVFKDDTLFRGSSATLVSLDIGLHRGFVDILREYKVFSQGTHSNMIHINVALDHRDGLTLSDDEFAEAAFGLVSPSTQSLTINTFTPYQCISNAIPTCPYLGNIQILHLENTELSVLEIFNILKHFPHVTDFGCCVGGIDPELDLIQDKLIPSHLGTQHSQFTSRLKCWHYYDWEPSPDKGIAVLFVTLAVLCPNFTVVRWLEWSKATYENEVGYILSSGLYDQHAERLGNLISYV